MPLQLEFFCFINSNARSLENPLNLAIEQNSAIECIRHVDYCLDMAFRTLHAVSGAATPNRGHSGGSGWPLGHRRRRGRRAEVGGGDRGDRQRRVPAGWAGELADGPPTVVAENREWKGSANWAGPTTGEEDSWRL